MNLSSLYHICIFLTIGLMVFTLVINFVGTIGVFGNNNEVGTDISGNSSEIEKNFTKSAGQSTGFNTNLLWSLLISIEVIGGIGLAIATQSASILGAYIFGAVFWTSYINAMSIISAVGFIPLGFITLFTVPMIFIFIGAVIGMLSGV